MEENKESVTPAAPEPKVSQEVKKLQAEIYNLKKALAESNSMKTGLKKAIDNLKAALVEAEKEVDTWREDFKKLASDFDGYKKEVAPLKEKMDAILKYDESVEIVAIPAFEGGVVGSRKINGEPAKEFVDEDGYKHFFLPRSMAEKLLADQGSPIKHVLIGPMDEIKGIRALVGMYAKEIPIVRHTKQIRNGKAVWIPKS